ncbi:ketoacyl-ACP synthase III [Candidatus Pacearchaeota archaeon]|nr:ketoacyl-ACP synthase III [Candidatus Pacearchaeota archaeon]
MLLSHLGNLEVIGTGSSLPSQVVKTEEFEGRDLWAYDLNEFRVGEPRRFTSQKIIDLTGIYERRKSAPNEWPSDMGYRAALNALEMAKISPDDLVGIVVATVSERDNFPSAAVKIQYKLGARNVVKAQDTQNACAGYPAAISDANSFSRDFPGYWLVVASEVLTKINDYTDINSHLFGDGAGAVVLKPTLERRGIVGTYSASQPFDKGIEMIYRGNIIDCIRMPDGRGVLKRAVRAMTESAVALKKQVGWERADVYIPHQANERIIEGVEDNLKGDGAVVYRNIAKYGNMSSATCAVALDEAIRDGTIKEGNRVVVTSFGAGLVTSAVALQF